MNRRDLLAASGGCALLGASGCLDRITPGGDFAPEYECERFEGLFGRILIRTPHDDPQWGNSEELRPVALDETGLLSREEIAGEMDAASRNRASAEDGELVGWVDLGNGELYDSVDESLSEFDPANTDGKIGVVRSNVQLAERWYVEYEGETYLLAVQHSAFPRIGPPQSSLIDVSPTDSPGLFGDAVDAEERSLDEDEYFRDLLEIARCSREEHDLVHPETASNLTFDITAEKGRVLTDIDDSGEMVVAYGDGYYEFELALADE